MRVQEIKARRKLMPARKPVSPFQYYSTAAILLIAAGTFLLHERYSLETLESYLIIINSVSFLYFVSDKFLARLGRKRIPENVLFGVVLAGGSPGGLAGMLLAWHKVSKISFQRTFWMIVLLQAIIGCIWFFAIR